MLLEVGIVALQELGRVQVVGTFLPALAAMEAPLYLLHLLVELLGEIHLIGRAAQEEVHTVAALYLDARGAGLAIAAAAAEVARKLLAVVLDASPHLVVEHRRIVLERDKLVELALALYAPYRLHVGELGDVGVGRGGMVYQTAGERLHGDESHVARLAVAHQLQLLVGGQVGERELQRLVESRLDGLVSHGQTVVGDAYVEHLALTACLKHGLIETRAVVRLGTERGIVELVELYMVGPQQPQRSLQVFPETSGIRCARLGGDDHAVATVVECGSQLFLAVGIETGSVEIVHAIVERLMEQPHRFLLADALDGQRTESVSGNLKVCLS